MIENTKKSISKMEMTKQYIDTLVKKINPSNLNGCNLNGCNIYENKLRKIDLVFSSGGFNGILGFGVGMYLKKSKIE